MSALPVGWLDVSLGDVCLPVSTVRPDQQPEDVFTYIDIGSIDRATKTIVSPQNLLGAEAPSRARQLVREGDILISTVRPNLQTIARVSAEFDGQVASTGFCVLRPADGISSTFLFYAVLEDTFQTRLQVKARGVSYPAVRDKDVFEEMVVLPPTAEQEEIAGRLDRVMEVISGGADELGCALDLLGKLRDRTFDDALTGRLTDAAEEAETWETVRLADITTAVTSGSRDWKPFYGRGDGVFIMAQNVRMRRLDLSEPFHVDPPLNDSSRVRSAVRKDDVLITIVGAGTGTVARVPAELHDHWVCQSVALVRPSERVLGSFLELFLAAPRAGQRRFAEKMYGQGRPHLSFEDIKGTELQLPPLDEQVRIVEAFERRMQACADLENGIADGLSHVSALRRAAIGAGVSGKLTDHDASSDAEDLLNRCREQRALVEAALKRAKKRRAVGVGA